MPYALRPCTDDYLDQALRATFATWNDGLVFEHYTKFWTAQLRTAWGAAHLDRVALVDASTPAGTGPVVASAKRYDLSMRLDGRIRRVLGIGAVFTMPPYRGRGAAAELMRQVLHRAEADGFEFAMLFSEIDPTYYERLDFVPVPLVESRLVVSMPRGGAPAALVRAGEDRDLPWIAEMHAIRSASARLALHRDEDFISYAVTKRRLLAGLRTAGDTHVEFLVVEEGHRAVAYLVATIRGGTWTVEEAGDRDPSGARLGALLQAMIARDPGEQRPEIRAWWPGALRPPQLEVVETGPPAEVLMLRPLVDRTLPLPPIEAAEVFYWHADAF